MAKIPLHFNFGDDSEMTVEELVVKLQRMYYTLAMELNKKPDVYQRDTDGLTTDTFLSNGDITINTGTLKVEMLTSHPTQSTVTWTTLS